MSKRLPSAIFLAAVVFVPFPHLRAGHHDELIALSRADREQAAHAEQLAGGAPEIAVRWLRSQKSVRRVEMGRDRETIDVHFRDAADVAILPRAFGPQIARPTAPPPYRGRLYHNQASNPVGSNGRAVVLEPFATELGLGPAAGQAEEIALRRAGFSVDILRDAQVTVGTMQNLAAYSVVYFQTHAGVLPNGDAVVVTGESNAAPYASLYQEHSLIQAFVAGDPTKTLYNAITSVFVTHHVGVFSAHTIVFLNGCAALGAPLFWQALHQQHVSALISWDADVYSSSNEEAGTYLITELANGDSVAASIDGASVAGVGTSVINGTVAHLGFLGDGTDTLQQALSGTAFTPTPTPAAPTAALTPITTATPKPRATAMTRRKRVRCERGKHVVHGHCRRKHRRTYHYQPSSQ